MLKNILIFFGTLFFLTGCVPQPKLTNKSQIDCVAEIIAVENTTIKNYIGTILGGVTGGVIGYQIGGTKKDNQMAATVGAVGGAFIGSMFDEKNNAQKLTIKADRDRKIVAIIKNKERLFEVGDKVKFFMVDNEVKDVILANNQDQIGCAVFKPSSIAKRCNELAKAGGNKAESHQVYLGKSQGEFILQFETFSAKDQIIVIHDNQVVFDSGCIGTQGWKEAKIPYNGFSEELTIKVEPNCMKKEPGTKWKFKVVCEQRIKAEKFIGVMTERIYDNSSKVWEYTVISKDKKRVIDFTSKNKIMYKNDLISLTILNSKDVDISSIKLLERNYYKVASSNFIESNKEQETIEKETNSAEALF